MRTRFRAVVLTAALITPVLVAAPASAQAPGVTVLAEGLNAPRGVATDAAGNTYVAESGVGGDLCTTEGDGEQAVEICLGPTSTVTRVTPDGEVDREFVTGLPSISFGGEGTGASGVSIAPDGTVYVSVGLGANVSERDAIVDAYGDDFPEAAMFGTLVRVDDGDLEIVADIARFEDDVNPDGVTEDPEAGPDSNANGVLATADTVYVADAGGNSILAVDPDTGGIEVAAVSPSRMVDVPEEMGGGQMPMQSVPTSLTGTEDGRVLYGELTGFPFPVDGANVYALTDDPDAPEVVASGFTNVMAVAERGDELLVLELATNGLLSGDLTGALVRVSADDNRDELLTDRLQFPGGMAVAPDGTVRISNGSVFPGGGQLLAVDLPDDPTDPTDPAIAAACPAGSVPSAELSDVAGSVHEDAIDCTAWFGVFEGFADGSFAPSRPITRAQFASTVARLIDATGTELPSGGRAAPDVRIGSTHDAAIRALLAAGVIEGFDDGTFRPSRSITRAQATTMVVRAYEVVTGTALSGSPDAWRDDDGSVHEGAIDAATQAGWIEGVRGGGFAPQRELSRGQVASVLARMASTLIDEGELQLPS